MCGRTVGYAVEFRIVRLIFLEHIVNGSQEHPGNSDDGFLVAPSLFQGKVTAANFRELLGTSGVKGALNKQGLDVGPCPADSGGFLLPGALVVLRREPSPGAKML